MEVNHGVSIIIVACPVAPVVKQEHIIVNLSDHQAEKIIRTQFISKSFYDYWLPVTLIITPISSSLSKFV
ncbi:MAG: hypothetical protein ACXAEU_16695 [Candidatus Hodarchaeales archaeon]|jgi:hypothetical protein